MTFSQLLPSRFLRKLTLDATVSTICLLALEPNLLFAESLKPLPNVAASPRLPPRRMPGLSGARDRFPL